MKHSSKRNNRHENEMKESKQSTQLKINLQPNMKTNLEGFHRDLKMFPNQYQNNQMNNYNSNMNSYNVYNTNMNNTNNSNQMNDLKERIPFPQSMRRMQMSQTLDGDEDFKIMVRKRKKMILPQNEIQKLENEFKPKKTSDYRNMVFRMVIWPAHHQEKK